MHKPSLFHSARMARSIAAAVMLMVAAASIHAADAMPKPQATSKSSVKSAKNQAKKLASKEGAQKGKARKELTGRDHQGNHDSLTKANKSGAKGDKHDKGIRQAGAAGSQKE
jgi:hypothetical protein